MLNAERFKDELRAFYESNKSYFVLRKDSGLFCNCGNCAFDSIEACSYARLKSLLSEEDAEPTSIEELLKNCEVVEDASN